MESWVILMSVCATKTCLLLHLLCSLFICNIPELCIEYRCVENEVNALCANVCLTASTGSASNTDFTVHKSEELHLGTNVPQSLFHSVVVLQSRDNSVVWM